MSIESFRCSLIKKLFNSKYQRFCCCFCFIFPETLTAIYLWSPSCNISSGARWNILGSLWETHHVDIFVKGDRSAKFHNCDVIFVSSRVVIVMDQNSIDSFYLLRKCCGNTKCGSPSVRIGVAKKKYNEAMDLNRKSMSILSIWILCLLPPTIIWELFH